MVKQRSRRDKSLLQVGWASDMLVETNCLLQTLGLTLTSCSSIVHCSEGRVPPKPRSSGINSYLRQSEYPFPCVGDGWIVILSSMQADWYRAQTDASVEAPGDHERPSFLHKFSSDSCNPPFLFPLGTYLRAKPLQHRKQALRQLALSWKGWKGR
eukprot:1157123-Pelagomonas_calceolata.AAC.2